MKRPLIGILAALGLALGLSSTAQAQTPLQTITKNGVTCSQYSSGFGPTYPTSMWDCANPTNPGNDISYVTQPALNLQTSPTNLKSSIANVQLYLFKNAANYASYTGATAPAANAFGATTTNLAAAFTTATQNGASVDLTSDIGGSILEQLGHFNDAAQATPFSSNAVFTTALAYDEAYMNSLPNNVWPSAYYTKYPGKTNWQIFQAIYPNANTDIFNYQFTTNANSSSIPSDLYSVLLNDMPNTRGWVKNYVFLATPANPAVAKNGVLCVQQFTNFGTYPTSMWDCLSPYNPGNEVSYITQPALNLQTTPTNLKASLANVQLYAFKSAANYVSFTGATAPAANAFGATTTNLAAAFSSAVQNGATVDLTSDLSGSIVEQLAHFNDAAQASPFSSNAVFTTALAYDEAYMNALPNNVWPSAYYTKYPGKTNWQIFQAIYPYANTDIFNYQFMSNVSTSAPSDLYNVLVNDMPNTGGWVKNYVFLATPANPAVAKNGVLCVQQSSGFGAGVYPTSMWDCVNPYNPGNDVSNITQPALNLPTAFKDSLTGTDLYAFFNAAKYVSFTGAPTPLANDFGANTVSSASAFASATQNGVIVNLTSIYSGDIALELGSLIDQCSDISNTEANFLSAVSSDIAYLNAQPNNVWPSAYYTKYAGKTNWQIFQAIYPSANANIFAYQFLISARQSTNSDLETVLVNYMPNTYAYMNNWFQAVSSYTETNALMSAQAPGLFSPRAKPTSCSTTAISAPFLLSANKTSYNASYGAPSAAFATRTVSDTNYFPTFLKAQIAKAAAAGWKFYIMKTPDAFQKSPVYTTLKITPAEYSTIRGRPALTDQTDKVQIFFEYFYPNGGALTSSIKITNWEGDVAHENEHINDSLLGNPSQNDPTFTAAYAAGVTAFNAAGGSTVDPDINSEFIANGTATGESELFAELGAYYDTGHWGTTGVSAQFGGVYKNPAHILTYWKNAWAYVQSQKAAGKW